MTYQWEKAQDYDSIDNPKFNVSEPVMERKVCEEEADTCVSMAGSDGEE